MPAETASSPQASVSSAFPERRGGVGVKQHVITAANRAELGQRLQHGGGGIPLHGQQQTGTNTFDGILHLIRGKHLTPWHLDGMHFRPAAAGDFAQQMAEAAKHRHQHFIARANGRHQNRLNARAGGAVHQHRPAVFGAEHPAIERHYFVHVVGHRRVVLTNQLARHGAQHARIGIDRPRPHQQTRRRIKLRKLSDIHC